MVKGFLDFLGDVLTVVTMWDGSIEASFEFVSTMTSPCCRVSDRSFFAFPPMRKPLPLGLLIGGGDVAGSAGAFGEGDLVRLRA